MGGLSLFGLALLLLTFLPVITIGLFVISRNERSPRHRAFALMSLTIALWAGSSIISDNTSSYEIARWFASSAFAFGIIALFTTLIFWMTFWGINTKRKTVATLSIATLVGIISATPAVYHLDDIDNYTNGPLYPAYLATAAIVSALIVTIFVKGYKKADTDTKTQGKFIIAGFLTLLILAATTNAIIPAIIQVDWITKVGPFFTVIFISAVAYAILKHKLFDIRLFVARSVGYVLSIGLITVLMTFIVFGLSGAVQSSSISTANQSFVYVTATLIFVLLYPQIKRFFDRLSNKIFYRDAYDSQELLNELNRALVTTIDLDTLLQKGGKVISDTIKIEFCSFAIRETESHKLRLIDAHHISSSDERLSALVVAAAHLPQKVVVFDELSLSSEHLANQLRLANVAALVKLQGRTGGRNHNPGVILLGHKKSGALYSSQDIQVLEIIADELVIAIQNALRFEEIQQFNITLRKKIDDATRELRRVNVRLRELDKTKDEFISMASHQLRTPLTAVKGYLSMILEGDSGPVKKNQKEMIQRSFDGAQKMVYLISDMLNVSRLQTGKFVIENKPTSLPDVVQGEVDQLKEEAAQKKITLNFKKPAAFPMLNLDETKMRQVIMNFLDNALYYTPSGGQIEVKLDQTPESATYTVTDTGVGVPKDVQHHLFSKFYRADNARKMRPDGTGLGLYMAKKVVTAQGGAIIFKSEEGKGSTFGFSFPRKSTEISTKK